MRVKTKLRINSTVSVLATIIIVAILIVAFYNVKSALKRSDIADALVNSVYLRSELRNDYILDTNERTKTQWFSEHERIGNLLRSASEEFKDVEEKAILDEMIKGQESIQRIFSRIVENREKTRSAAAFDVPPQDIENRLLSQLAIRRYSAILNAHRLQDAGNKHLVSGVALAGWSIVCVIALLAAAITVNSWLMVRTITSRIGVLQEGASIIGEGNLDHRIDSTGDDEFSELSRAFNVMTEKLGRSYVDLEKEIAERKKTHEELKRTAILLDETQAIARVGGWELDPAENKLFWTGETYRIHETSPSEYRPTVETAIAFYAPESVPIISNAVKEAVEQGKEFFLELQLVTARGRLIWVEAVGRPIRADGRVVKVIGAFRDITERKKADALRQSNAYHRSLIEASLDPLVTIDEKGKVTDVNAATEKVTGRRRDELIGTDFSDYFTEPEKAREGYQQVFREGSVMDYALEIKGTEGHITPVLYNAAVYRDESGNVIGVFAAARDITERIQAEEKLKLANAYNRSLIEASLDPLVTISADGKITDVNIATEKVTGRSRAELIDTDFSDYFTEPAKAKAGYREVFEEGFVMDYALEIRRRDGHVTPVLYNAAVYNDDAGKVIGVFAAARDITERKKAEEALNNLNRELEARVIDRTAQLESTNRELEAFAYSVSHDLRSPLRSIEGFSTALVEDYADKLDEAGKGYLNRVRAATVRMGQLIDDLLKLSRVTRGEMTRERVDLGAIVREIAGNFRKHYPERSAEIIVASGLVASGDARLLTIMLENLLSNAWKYSEKTDHAVIEFGTADCQGGGVFYIKDNGVGFDMAYAGKLFSPFQRLHAVDEFAGTGIGLATVKRIVSRHNGRVWIESEMNKGTTVFFTLG